MIGLQVHRLFGGAQYSAFMAAAELRRRTYAFDLGSALQDAEVTFAPEHEETRAALRTEVRRLLEHTDSGARGNFGDRVPLLGSAFLEPLLGELNTGSVLRQVDALRDALDMDPQDDDQEMDDLGRYQVRALTERIRLVALPAARAGFELDGSWDDALDAARERYGEQAERQRFSVQFVGDAIERLLIAPATPALSPKHRPAALLSRKSLEAIAHEDRDEVLAIVERIGDLAREQGLLPLRSGTIRLAR